MSTDAAVADFREIEIELGYFNLARDSGRNTFIVPKVMLNYGFFQNLELVGEFSVEEPSRGSVQLADPALSLKAVLSDGVLQEKSGVSFAVEPGPLFPSINSQENRTPRRDLASAVAKRFYRCRNSAWHQPCGC